jgi:16S rRNA C967 or C1407 C5-methylase (RsmB/RsmF family)/NOL1/NOP2/fmu family ribosome biogenesis protein
MASLTNIKGFDKEAFEQVHASGEQVTSIRLNPTKTANVNREASIVNRQSSMVNIESAIRNHQSAINDLLTNDPMTGFAQSAIANLQSTIPWCSNAYYLRQRPSFTFDPLFHAGLYYVQEASSMFLWEALRQTVGENTGGVKVLDLCAAPGGKSTLLATYFANGLVVANEVIRNRAAILAENITKWGSANVVVTNNGPKDFAKLEGYFDVMVVDAPCSGSGLFRKDAEAITEWSDANVLLCSQRQQRILADAWASLKNDGVLIYSTCSYSKQEDEDIVGWICSEFGAEPVQLSINEGWGIVEVQDDASKAFGYRFYPYMIKGEGFFIAAFKKRGGKEFADKAGAAEPQKISKEEAAAVAPFISSAEELYYFRQAEIIIAAPARWKNDISLLQKHLYLRKAGITVGELKGKDLVPNHELATSLISNSGIPSVSLSYQQAIQYLQKKDIQLNNLPKGWALATYAGISLGWIKVLPNRINNYYPMEWRILKLIHPA